MISDLTTMQPALVVSAKANGRRPIRIGLLLIALAFGGGGAWAALVPLSAAIIAPGVVKVADNRKTVQHFEGGIVKAIHVREGDRVAAGQTLMTLADERVSANLDLLQRQLDAVLARTARLQAERDGTSEPVFSELLHSRADDAKVAALMQGEEALFRSNRDDLRHERELLSSQGQHIEQQVQALQRQQLAEAEAAELLQQELDAHRRLLKTGAVTKTEIFTLQRGIKAFQARHGELAAIVARARQQAAELALRSHNLVKRYRQSAATELAGLKLQRFDLEERLRPTQDAVQRQTVVAPVAGWVVNLNVFTVGGVIKPGEALLDIVPADRPLVVEARIELDTIDSLRHGMTAEVRMTAYSARTVPRLEGVVDTISADQVIDQVSGVPHFLAQIQLDPGAVAATADQALSLRPGMRAEVFLRTGQRTALDYLLAPIISSLDRAVLEP